MTWHTAPILVWALQAISKHFNCNNCHWQQLFSEGWLISISRGYLKCEEHTSCLLKYTNRAAAQQHDECTPSLWKSSAGFQVEDIFSSTWMKTDLMGTTKRAAGPGAAGQAAFGQDGCEMLQGGAHVNSSAVPLCDAAAARLNAKLVLWELGGAPAPGRAASCVLPSWDGAAAVCAAVSRLCSTSERWEKRNAHPEIQNWV